MQDIDHSDSAPQRLPRRFEVRAVEDRDLMPVSDHDDNHLVRVIEPLGGNGSSTIAHRFTLRELCDLHTEIDLYLYDHRYEIVRAAQRKLPGQN